MPARNPKLAFREEDEKPVPTPAPINAGDAVARDLFGGAAFQPNALPRLGRTIGRAVAGAIDATKDAFTPLIPTQYGDSMAAAPVPNVPAFPSGAIGSGFDIYPSSPQMAPSKPQPFPYGHALGPSVYRQDPTQTTLTTGLVGGVGTAKDFSSVNPQPYAGYIPFGDSGTTMMSLGFGGGGQRTFYPSTTDITGRSTSTGQNVTALTGTTTPFVGAENPMLAANPRGFTPFTPLSERVAPLPVALPMAASMPIEGGPMSFSGATAMTEPKTAEQKGLTRIQLPSGEAWVTAKQRENYQSAIARQEQEAKRMDLYRSSLAKIRSERPKKIAEREIESQKATAERAARLIDMRAPDLVEQMQKEQERGFSARDVKERIAQLRVREELAKQRAANAGKFETVTDSFGRQQEKRVRTPFFSYEKIIMPSGEEAYAGSMGQYRIFNKTPTTPSPFIPYGQAFNPYTQGQNPFSSIYGASTFLTI